METTSRIHFFQILVAIINPPPQSNSPSDPSPLQPDPPAPPVVPVPKGFVISAPIRTHAPRAAWTTMLLMSFPWFCLLFNIFAIGTAGAYTLKRYTDDPQIIALVTSMAGLIALFIGPITSFLSDKIWTPLGRRKPFLLMAWSSMALGLALIPLVPVIGPVINSLLEPILGHGIRELFYLTTIIIMCSTLHASFSGPLEPICLEIVPSDQRGTYWAMRSIGGNLASLYFFQLLWPIFDMKTSIISLSWMRIELTGEQMIYTLASGLFFINALHLLFNVKETKVESAENLEVEKIQILPFVISFIKDVFGDKRWYPLYIVMVIPGITEMVWGPFRNFLQTDQFGYSKGVMALMGLPSMVLSMAVITPFAGWYSDRKPKLNNVLMVLLTLLGVGSLWATIWFYGHTLHPDKLEIPVWWINMILCGLASLSTISFFVVFIEILLKYAKREDMRVWISTLAVVKDAGFTLGMYLLIKFGCTDGVPPATLWMLAGQFGGTTGAMIAVVVGPMIFEYIPSNRFGTVASGSGILSGIIGFLAVNLGAWWIEFYTKHFGTIVDATGKALPHDYSSMYLLQLVLVPIAVAAKLYFLYMVIKEKITPCGRKPGATA